MDVTGVVHVVERLVILVTGQLQGALVRVVHLGLHVHVAQREVRDEVVLVGLVRLRALSELTLHLKANGAPTLLLHSRGGELLVDLAPQQHVAIRNGVVKLEVLADILELLGVNLDLEYLDLVVLTLIGYRDRKVGVLELMALFGGCHILLVLFLLFLFFLLLLLDLGGEDLPLGRALVGDGGRVE